MNAKTGEQDIVSARERGWRIKMESETGKRGEEKLEEEKEEKKNEVEEKLVRS